ncbi:MAG: PDZ domain-containing protein [Bacteroidales bacterium]
MMRQILSTLLVILGFTASMSAQDEMRLLRFPAIHGNQVVFSYAGDLYTVSTEGGIARRLTSDPGYEMFPRFSPDGKQIAFTGQYDGNTEIYLIPATGGLPKRLTHTATLSRDDISDRMGPNNIVMTWTPDGKNIIYRSRMNSFNDFVGHLFSVPSSGGTSVQLPFSSGGFCSYSPDGGKIAFNRVFREFRTWKYYRGGMADDIRIFDFKTKETVNITNHGSQDIVPMWYGNQVFFLSDRDRIMNLFVYDNSTRTTKKVTNFTDYDIKFPSLGDGRIIFEQAGYLHVYDITAGTAKKLTISIADDQEPGRLARKDASKHMHGMSLSPDGKRLVVNARGDIFSVPAENGITRNLTATSGVHERAGVWSPDGKHIAYLSDESGEFQIYTREQDGVAPPVQLTKQNDNYIYRLLWSPDSRKILYNDKKMNLNYVDVESRKVVTVARNGVWEFSDFNWSPDSKWITYSLPVRTGMHQIMLYEVNSKNTITVTQPWYSSSDPAFSNDGKFLVFISQRDFSPIYSGTEWNHAYRNMAGIYLIPLSASTKNPLGERNDEVSITKIAESKENSKQDDKNGKADSAGTKTSETRVNTVVDADGIQDRIIALPIRASNYYNVNMIGSKVYYSENYFGEQGNKISMYNLETRKETLLAENMGYSLSADGKKMLLSSRGTWYVIATPSARVKVEKKVDVSNMAVMADLQQEWKQIYTECWRQMRDFFYDENMHGLDWKAMHDKYAALLPYVSNRNDLNYLIGELIGELNVGHAYISGGDKYDIQRIHTGLLGATMEKDKSGFWQITRILPGQNWDPKLVSPLTQVGVNVKEGEYILAIDGNSTKDIDDIYILLAGKGNNVVELTISSKPTPENARKVVVKTITDESSLLYFNWVQENIRKVNEATNGEVGYLHIPDMVTTGLNEFVKYYYPQLTKKALIIDGRGNGGGNVSPMIIERLRREIIRISAPRNVEELSTTPGGMMNGPMVLLINQYSASDGDLFPYSFQKLGIGPVIGVRSWGGVVGIRGSLPLIDGGSLSKPEFGTFSSDTGEWIIEGHGVDPDIVIDNDPYQEFMGKDDQLNKAIEVILGQLKDAYQIPAKPAGPKKN